MPALVDLLDQFFFSDAPGAQARDAVVHAWRASSGKSWDALYVDSLDDALSEELPHLSAYSGNNTPRPTAPELAKLVHVDLGEAGNHLVNLDRNSGTFLTELARAMQAQRLIVINEHNLFTDEYRQILLNLFDHAHIRFKTVVVDHESTFSAALASAAGFDAILTASISNFLERAFNVALPSLSAGAQPDIELPTSSESYQITPESLALSNQEPPTTPEEVEPLAVETPVSSIRSEDNSVPPKSEPRSMPNRLRVLVATAADVTDERAQIIRLMGELDAQARTRFGVELALVNPTPGEVASVASAVELADIFIGAVWLRFGATSVETDSMTGATFFAGTERDFAIALEQGSERNEGWLRTVVYRSIRPPLDLLHLDVASYTRVQQFFERASAYGGEDLVRVYNDSDELLADARARLEAWIYNYAGDLAFALSEYARNAALGGKPTDALGDFDQAIALYRELDRPELEMELWSQVGALQQTAGNRDHALRAFDVTLRLAHRLEDDDAAAGALHRTGQLYAGSGDWSPALRAYQQARGHLKPDAALYRTILADEITALLHFGDAERAAEELEHAGGVYRDALALAQEMDDAARTAEIYERLGAFATQRGEHLDAIAAYQSALEHLDPTNSDRRRILHDAQAGEHAQLANRARESGNLESAESSFIAALNANAQGSQQRAQDVEWRAALAEMAFQRGDWSAAIGAYSEALAQLDSPEDAQQRQALMHELANAHQRLAEEYFQAGQLDAASGAYREALDLYQELDAREQQGEVLTQLGAVSAADSRWQEATTYFAQAIPRLDAPAAQDSRQRAQRAQATALTHIGDAHRAAQEWGQAEFAYVQARGNLEQIGASAETGELLVNLGLITAAQARWQEALAFFQQARARLTAPEHTEAYKTALGAEANTLRQIGDLRRDAGDFVQAQATYRQQLDLAQELGDTPLQSDALYQLGRVAADQSRWDEAVDLYDQALAHAGAPTSQDRARIQHAQLDAYVKMGERERAAEHYSQTEMAYRSALTLAQSLNDRDREAELLNTLGLVSIEQGNWDEALVDLRRALGIYNLMPSAPNKPKVIWNIGRAQRGAKHALLTAALDRIQTARTNDTLASATPDLESALHLTRDLGDTRTEGLLLADIGDVASAHSDWEAALTAYDDAVTKLTDPEELERRAQIQRAKVNALRHRSAKLREDHQWAAADADLSVALGLARELNDDRAKGELVYESGLVAAGQARWNDAINLYSAALDAFDETSEQRSVIEGAQAEAYRALGNSEYNGQNWQGAEASYSQSLSLQRNRGDLGAQAILLAALGDVAMRQGEWSSAVDWLTQARPLTAETAPERIALLDADLERATVALRREQQVEAETRGDARRAARDLASAAGAYTQALALAEELQDRPAQAELNAKLGFIASERGELSNALTFYRVAASGYDAVENAPQRAALVELQAQTLQEMGNRATEEGNWTEALELYQNSVALLDSPTQSEQRITSVRLAALTLQNIGVEATKNEDWNKALASFRRGAGLFRVVGDPEAQRVLWSHEATALMNLARHARAAGQYLQMLDLYRQAADQLNAAQDSTALGLLESERVSAYQEAGDAFARAQDWRSSTIAYQDGYALAEQIGDRAGKADLLYQLGRVSAEQTDWESALSYFKGAQAIADETANRELRQDISRAQVTAYQSVGDTQRAAGQLDGAEENYNGALTAALELNDRAKAGELYFILGMLAADAQAWDKALGNYGLALEHMDAIGSPNRVDVVSYQTFAFQQWGDLQRGAGQIDAAASAYASALERAEELNDQERAGEILYRRGLLDAAKGEWQAALEAYAQAEIRLGTDSDTRATMQNDTAIATRAIRRTQLAGQLERAQLTREELQWDDSATAYRAALDLAHVLDDEPAKAAIERDLVTLFADKANAVRAQEMWDEADNAYRESLLLARKFHLDEDVTAREADIVGMYADKAAALRDQAEWDEAGEAYRTSLDLAREFALADQMHAREADLVGMYADKAAAFRNQTQWDEAGEAYRTSLELAREFELEPEARARELDLVAVAAAKTDMLFRTGDLNSARVAAQAQLVLADEFSNSNARADAYFQLGAIARQQSDFSTAIEHYERARPHLVAAERSEALVQLDTDLESARNLLARRTRQAELLTLAQAAHAAGRYNDANTNYRSALDIARELEDADARQVLETGLVSLALDRIRSYQEQGQWNAAEAAAHEADAVAKEFDNLPARADALYELGRAAAEQKKWLAAQNYYAQARAFMETQDRATELRRLDNDLAYAIDILERQSLQVSSMEAGKLAFANGQYLEAADEFRTSVRAAESLGENADSPLQADAHFELGQVAFAQAQWDPAIEQFEIAMTAFSSLNAPERKTIAESRLVQAASAAGDERSANKDWESARIAYTLGLGHAEATGTPEIRTHILSRLAQGASEEKNWSEAITLYERALGEAPNRSEIVASQAHAWQELGDEQMDAHQHARAQESYEHALALYTEVNLPTQCAQVLHSIGLVQSAQGNLARALETHKQAYSLIEDLDVAAFRVEMLRSIAETQRALGQHQEARMNYQIALADAETGVRGELEFELGELAATQEHWQDALTHLEAARANFVAIGDSSHTLTLDTQEANAHVNLAELLYGEGQWSDAEEAFSRALELDAATGRINRDGYLNYRIGLTKAAQQDHAGAVRHYDEAVSSLSADELDLGNRILGQLAHSLQQEGKRAQGAGEWAQAETALTRALKMAEAVDNFDQAADLWFRLGNLYSEQARMLDAGRAYRRAFDLDRADGNALQQREISDALAGVLLKQARAALDAGQTDQGTTHLEDALGFAELAENPQLFGSIQETLAETAGARGDMESAIDHFTRAGRTFAAIEDTTRWKLVSQRQADILRRVGAERLDTQDYPDAENYFRRALLLQQATGDSLHDAGSHYSLGRALSAQERYDEALAELEEADALFDATAPERRVLDELRAGALEEIGNKAFAQTQWEDAKHALTRSVNYRDASGQRTRAGLIWQRLAEIASAQNAPGDAVLANEQALARLDTPESSDARREVLRHQAQVLIALGESQQRSGDWAQASETYRSGLEIAKEQGDLPALARLYAQVASLAVAQEHWGEARIEYEHALEVYEELEQPVAQAEIWTNLGDMHRQATEYDDAVRAFQHARELYHNSGSYLKEGAMLLRLGHVEGDREEWDHALDKYQSALRIYNEIDARRAKPDVYRAMERALRNAKLKSADHAAAQGDRLLDAGDWAEAEGGYREALDLYAEADERIMQAQMQNQIGVALEAQMQFDQALEQYRSAFAGFEQAGIPEAQVGVLSNIGDVQRGRKLWNEAEAAYRQALALSSNINDLSHTGELYNSLGIVREEQGDWEGAIEHYQQAAVVFENSGLVDASDEARQSLARAERGARSSALAEYKRALETARSSENVVEAGEILNTLGLMAAEDKQYDLALDYYRQAVTIFEQLEREADTDVVWRTAQGTVLNNIGEASQQIGAWRDADYAYSRALSFAREIGDRESEAVLLNNLGVTAQQQAQLPRALDLALQALESYRALGDETPLNDLLERVGDLQMELAQATAADHTYGEALTLARETNDQERVARLLQKLGALAEGRGADQEALNYYEEVLAHSTPPMDVQERKAVLLRQADVYARGDRWEEAERSQLTALSLAAEQNDEPLQAELHMKLGATAAARGEWRDVLRHDQAALALYEQLDSLSQQYALHERLAEAHANLGELGLAEDSYRAALELAARVGRADTSALWLARARLAERQNRWNDAAAHYESARQALPPTTPSGERIELLFQRGDAALNAGEWHTADVSYNDALEIANGSGNRLQYGLGMNRLGVLARAQREWDQALEYFQEAVEILRQNQDPLAEAHVLNNIARLKLENDNPAEAELFAQAAVAIAQALGSGQEAAASLYIRALIALEAQEFTDAQRFLNQAIAADPANWVAQLQLGNAILALGNVTEAIHQAEAGMGQTPAWELGAQAQLAIASLYQEDQRSFKQHLKRSRGLLAAAQEHQRVAPEFRAAVELVVRAMEGDAENSLTELNSSTLSAGTLSLDGIRFARTALLALARSPRRFKGKPALVTYFARPKPRGRKGVRRRDRTKGDVGGMDPGAPDSYPASKDDSVID